MASRQQLLLRMVGLSLAQTFIDLVGVVVCSLSFSDTAVVASTPFQGKREGERGNILAFLSLLGYSTISSNVVVMYLVLSSSWLTRTGGLYVCYILLSRLSLP